MEEIQGVERVPREAVVDECWACKVGEAMEQFPMEGIDHMEWDAGSDQFIKTSPQVLPLMFVQVKVLSQVQKKFLGRKAQL